jgi:hypothetical protein
LRRAEGGAKIFGVFRVKNHDFTPKNHIFPILEGAREIVWVFHVKNHDFTPIFVKRFAENDLLSLMMCLYVKCSPIPISFFGQFTLNFD